MTKSRRAIIFGTASFAEVVNFYLTEDSDYKVIGFTTSDAEAGETFRDMPVYRFGELRNHHAPGEVSIFVAIGYRKMNRIRAAVMQEVEAAGYDLLSYVHSGCHCFAGAKDACSIGRNVFVFEDNTLQPFSSIGDGTILWSGNHIGHHTRVGNHCFISSHVVVSGHCDIGDNSFIGVNATIADSVKVGKANLIGATCLIDKNTEDEAVYLLKGSQPFGRKSDRFFK
jgi:sugar O-acyltransferase (sialic acid O-acetyltransferase NeuD family)